MAIEQELKINNKNKVQEIIFIVNVMRVLINIHTLTEGLSPVFEQKRTLQTLHICRLR